MRFSLACALIACASIGFGQRNNGAGSFAPTPGNLHYAPDRTCDLTHLKVDIDIDYANRVFTGRSENTMVPLRDGITQIILNAGPSLKINRITLDGSEAKYTRQDRKLLIDSPPTKKGRTLVIAIEYSAANSRGRSFGGGGGGFHWITGDPGSSHVGFWTQGESDSNSDWAPTWDYPNDLTTSETHCTVPADWTVIGNGTLQSNKLSSDGKKRTFFWKMDLPHATYLLSLLGGPVDMKRDNWRGVPLIYVVPKGLGQYIDDTFGGTKDMLSFYSDTLGFKYCWPKYAQSMMYDFGGGMENVSATTMGVEVTEARDGFRLSDSLESHEMAHQWFGDTVTCMDWGDIWLNESFATFMQMAYFEHSRGKNGYDTEVDNNMSEYFNEARRYQRPISTKYYPNPDAMFDSHTYPKGGVVLHTLRRELGDAPFWSGLNLYLHTYQHTPVQATQLCRSFTEATGINCQPFFDQWIFKPGHPVLDYSWTPDATGTVTLDVKQTQNTAEGTPIYHIPAKVLVISGGTLTRYPVVLDHAEDKFVLPTGTKPDVVILDADHDFLREIPNHKFTHDELVALVKFGPETTDRSMALRQLLTDSPSDADVQVAADAVRADTGQFPAFQNIFPLVNLKRESLRPLFEALLTHSEFQRRVQAVSGLSYLNPTAETKDKLRAMINPKEAIGAVVASIHALAGWDAKGNVDIFTKALAIPSRGDRIKSAAQDALNVAKG